MRKKSKDRRAIRHLNKTLFMLEKSLLGEVTKIQGFFTRRLGRRDQFLTEASVDDLVASFGTGGAVIGIDVDVAKLCQPDPTTKECWLFKALLSCHGEDEDALLSALKSAEVTLQVKPRSIRRTSI